MLATDGERTRDGQTDHSATPRHLPGPLHRAAGQLGDLGFIAAGSVTRRYTRCASPGCRCNAEPSQPHGPYWQWTAKLNGKTVTRRLSEDEARLYKEWIANDRRLRALVTKMRHVATQATDLILKDAAAS